MTIEEIKEMYSKFKQFPESKRHPHNWATIVKAIQTLLEEVEKVPPCGG